MIRRTRNLVFLPLLLLAVYCTREPEIPNQEPQEEAAQESSSLIPGQVIIQVDDRLLGVLEEAQNPCATKSDAFNELAGALGVTSARRVFPDGGRFEARHRAAGLHRWYRLCYDETLPATRAADGLEMLSSMEGILSVERPRKKELMKLNYFNDPYAYNQWHLYNDGSQGSSFKSGSDINVLPVWKEFTTGSKEVIVAVIDSGVDLTHEDLEAVVIPAGPEGSRNFAVYPDLGEYEIVPADHGTHVAGIIGAVNNNKKGVCGVAGGNDGTGGVRILSCSLSSERSEHLDGDDEAAFVWAADHGAVIANNSWGYTFDSEADARSSFNSFENSHSALRAAIDYFIDYAGLDENGIQVGPMKGGVVLFSSGNAGFAYGVPAGYSRVIAVGAMQQDYFITDYSNYGTWVDVWAPGGGEEKTEQLILSTIKNNHYAWMAGTSQACPNASGVAALLVSYFGGPGFTNEQLTERLLWGAKYKTLKTRGKTIGGGMLDAYGSFTYKGRTPVAFTTDYTGNFSFKSHEKAQIRYAISGNDDEVLLVEGSSTSPAIELTLSSTEAVLSIDALKGNPGTYQVSVVVGKGSHFEARLDIPVTILPNHAPVVAKKFESLVLDAETKETVQLNLSEYFTDEDGETLSYQTEVSSGNVVTASVSGGVLTVKTQTYGQGGVVVTATDARGESVKQSFSLLARDASRAADLYPNPMSDNLYVRPASQNQVSVRVTLCNQAGAQVLEQTVNASLLQPATISVRSLPSGVYTVSLTMGTEHYKTTLVKL